MQKIEIPSKWKPKLANKFNTSKVTVQQALNDYNHSDLAKKIRKEAKRLLEQEAKQVII